MDFHGSQCGFCTPGIVMSLYGLWMRKPDASEGEIETALQGNLCRCTGYQPIIAAARAAAAASPDADPLLGERAAVRGEAGRARRRAAGGHPYRRGPGDPAGFGR